VRDRPAAARSERHLRLARAGIISGAALLILLYARLVGLRRLHLLGWDLALNDQAIYIDAARHLLAQGELTTGAIYPSTLLQDYGRNYLYMPGHAVLLALSFAAFGDAPWSAMLPNLLGYLLCLTGIWITGRTLAGMRAGALAALGFALTPAFLVFAFSAMAELTSLAAGLLALAAFVHLPLRSRHWAAPLLLLGPFLCRETGALWVVPMLVLTLSEGGLRRRERWRAAAVTLVGSIVILGAVHGLDWIADRPSLWGHNLYGTAKYSDAFALERLERNPDAVLDAALRHIRSNLRALLGVLATASVESWNLHLVLWIPLLGAWWAWRTPRLRPLVVAWALFAGSFVALITTLYRWDTLVGLRHMLSPMLMGLLVSGAAVAERNPTPRHMAAVGAALGIWLLALALVVRSAAAVTRWQEIEDRMLELVQRIPVPARGVFVTNPAVGPIYLYHRPLRTWAFTPADAPTLRLLERKHDVRGALLTSEEIAALTEEALLATGLRYRGAQAMFLVFEEPEAP
jgi:4-amino-4-deoxy-L-arabinose transferase-like glycosyltransferase